MGINSAVRAGYGRGREGRIGHHGLVIAGNVQGLPLSHEQAVPAKARILAGRPFGGAHQEGTAGVGAGPVVSEGSDVGPVRSGSAGAGAQSQVGREEPGAPGRRKEALPAYSAERSREMRSFIPQGLGGGGAELLGEALQGKVCVLEGEEGQALLVSGAGGLGVEDRDEADLRPCWASWRAISKATAPPSDQPPRR